MILRQFLLYFAIPTILSQKHLSQDQFHNPSLNNAHQYVRWVNARGMCTDLELWNTAITEDDEGREQQVMTQTLEEAGGFDGFVDAFWENGGRAGGW